MLLKKRLVVLDVEIFGKRMARAAFDEYISKFAA
jgi:hypothetical protein